MAVRPDTIWDTIERILVGLVGALAMIVGLVQVVGRYLFPALAISWAEEVIVYLIVWGVMIISSQPSARMAMYGPSGAARWCRRRATMDGGVQLHRGIGVLRGYGVVRLADRRYLPAAG